MKPTTDVAIIGAGPYGLSLAAHLSAMGVGLRIFGSPMQTWRTAMPQGMVLKSEGFASSLYDPDGTFTLAAYCAQQRIPYADVGLPVPLDVFVSYGQAFQKRFVPELEERMVVSVEPSADGFDLRLDDGTMVTARRVVVASGIRHFDYVPPGLAGLPDTMLSHSAAHCDLRSFAGREVAVVGAGASAIDLAALLHRQGAAVTVVARAPALNFCGAPRPRTLLDKVKYPVSGLGTGWRSLMCVRAPVVFHQMPERFRLLVVRKHLGPAPGWSVRAEVEKNVPCILGATLSEARAERGRAHLTLRLNDGQTREISADHVIAATGYKVDLRRLSFLGERIQSQLRCVEHTPVLSRQFESSVRGLYFVGTAAANSFGPLLRFAYGAGFTARRLSRHLARSALRAPRGLPLAENSGIAWSPHTSAPAPR